MNTADLHVIDFRARPNTSEYMDIYSGKNAERSWERFGYPKPPNVPLETFVETLDTNGLKKAVFTGRQGVQGWISNDYIADCVNAFPDRIVGFAGIDPRSGPEAVREARRAIQQLGLTGLSFDPPDGADDVRGRPYDDERVMYPLYQAAVELDVPVVLTLGPLMTPFSFPSAIERIAADFPKLRIVCSHAGWPSVTEWIALAYRYENVFLEPSIYIYLPGGAALVEAANTILPRQMVYASAFPFNGLEVIRRFEKLGFSDDVLPLLLQKNAESLIGTSVAAPTAASEQRK